MDQAWLDRIQVDKANGTSRHLFDHHIVDLRVPMDGSKPQLAQLTRVFKDVGKGPALLYKLETVLHFCAGFVSIVGKCLVKILKITRCNMETFQRIRELIYR